MTKSYLKKKKMLSVIFYILNNNFSIRIEFVIHICYYKLIYLIAENKIQCLKVRNF